MSVKLVVIFVIFLKLRFLYHRFGFGFLRRPVLDVDPVTAYPDRDFVVVVFHRLFRGISG
jgi:hypothetical protein